MALTQHGRTEAGFKRLPEAYTFDRRSIRGPETREALIAMVQKTLFPLGLFVLMAVVGLTVAAPATVRAQLSSFTLQRDTLAADSNTSFEKGEELLQTPATSKAEVMKLSRGLEALGASGHLVVLDKGTKVESTGTASQVRVLVGPHTGQVWYLFNHEDVRKDGDVPPGAVEVR